MKACHDHKSSSMTSSCLAAASHFNSGVENALGCLASTGAARDIAGEKPASLVNRLLFRPGRLARWRLNGLATASASFAGGAKPFGGVPALAVTELIDFGVPASVDSSPLMCGDLRVVLASLSGSAEC